MQLNFCDSGGFLVSGGGETPSDPSEYQTELRRPVIGCTEISCDACGAAVRSAVGLFPLVEATWDSAMLHAADDWSTLEGMDHDPAYRLYACRCRFDAVNSSRPLIRDDGTTTPWRCAGHSPAAFPIVVNGVEITRLGDVERVVREHLEAPDSMLVALYERLAGTSVETRIGEVAGRLLFDPNPRAKMTALGLYWLHPEARGARRVLELARGDRAGLTGVPDPIPIAGMNLEGRLLRTVAELWSAGVLSDEETLELVRCDALRRDTSRAVIPTLYERDREWLRGHAVDIVTSAPNAVGMLLVHLYRGFGESIDVSALASRAAGLSDDEKGLVRNEIAVNFMSPLRDGLLVIFA